jgi:hypothetical protein
MLYWRNVEKRVLWHCTFLWIVALEKGVCTSSVPLKKMLAKHIEHFMAGGLTVGILFFNRKKVTKVFMTLL